MMRILLILIDQLIERISVRDEDEVDVIGEEEDEVDMTCLYCILLLPYSISSGALESPDLLP